jgi:C4-type Zn-finger protein
MADEAQPVRCPICKREQAGLTVRKGQLWSGNVQVLGYVCQGCGHTIHWGIRGAKKQKKTARRS